jgi:molecular chaperone GrpE
MVDKQRNPSEGEPKPSPDAQASAAAGPEGQVAPEAPPASDGEIARLRAELEEAKDRALRGWAELENYRKRASRQLDEERRYAAMPLVRDLLPVLDNVRRAVDAAEKTHDTASLLEGIKMVVQQLQGVLARHHCTPIAALHRPFDPNVHDAILHQPSAEFPPNTVLREVQQGFQLHDRVVRPTQVIVSSPREETKSQPPPSEDHRS